MNIEYIRCENCKRILQLLDKEKRECPYCGNDLAGSDIVTERIHREYWKGIKMQVFKYNIIKSSTQTTFIR